MADARLYHGLDLMGPTMMFSSNHDQSVISENLERFRAVFTTLSTLGTLIPIETRHICYLPMARPVRAAPSTI